MIIIIIHIWIYKRIYTQVQMTKNTKSVDQAETFIVQVATNDHIRAYTSPMCLIDQWWSHQVSDQLHMISL